MNYGLWMNGAAASLIAMTGERALQGLTMAVADDVDPVPVAALKEAGAVILDGTRVALHEPAAFSVAIDGRHSLAMPSAFVAITPTDGTLGPSGATVFASSLDEANAVLTVAAAAGRGRWPSDVRLAAPPEPVIAIPTDLDDPRLSALASAATSLKRAGARVVTVPAEDLRNGLGDADAALVPTGSTWPTADGSHCSVSLLAGSFVVVARAFDDAVALDVATAVAGVDALQDAWPLAVAEHTELVVFGAHLRGGPLVHQLTDLGARWSGDVTTSDRYRMTLLPTTPAKPAITRVADGAAGTALMAQAWLLSPAALGRFLIALPAPMQLGKVEFDDGSWRTSFGCDGVAADAGDDISRFGGWAAAVAAGAVG